MTLIIGESTQCLVSPWVMRQRRKKKDCWKADWGEKRLKSFAKRPLAHLEINRIKNAKRTKLKPNIAKGFEYKPNFITSYFISLSTLLHFYPNTLHADINIKFIFILALMGFFFPNVIVQYHGQLLHLSPTMAELCCRQWLVVNKPCWTIRTSTKLFTWG